MKTIGILGGLTWHSTQEYYKIINETIAKAEGGKTSAKIILISLNFNEFYKLQQANKISELEALIELYLNTLKLAGADFAIVASNTAHKYIPDNVSLTLPVLHVAKASAALLIQHKIKKIGLLGTRLTLTDTFYISKLQAENIEVIIPNTKNIDALDTIIFEELAMGIISEHALNLLQKMVAEFCEKGAEAVLLACTELILLAEKTTLYLPYFDTAEIHAEAAANYALEGL